jgi:hypothetical protein
VVVVVVVVVAAAVAVEVKYFAFFKIVLFNLKMTVYTTI